VERRDQISQWGYINLVISFRIKVRVMEDLIDKAQNTNLKSDQEAQQELDHLRQLRD
jgi:hypothetical protein